jgi:ParB family chromosome partitioning protein
VIIEKSLNVRQTEELVRKYTGQKSSPIEKPTASPEVKAIEDRLRSHLGTKVRLNHGKRGGSITITYYSDEELDTIINRILS